VEAVKLVTCFPGAFNPISCLLGCAIPRAGGLTVAQYLVPGNSWSGLQPSTQLNFTTVASGVAASGGAFAVVEIPGFQRKIPSFGTHYPVRFMPALIALGPSIHSSSSGGSGSGADNNSSSVGNSSGSSGGNSSGTGPWSSAPAAAGTLVVPYCCGDVEQLVWWEAPPSAADAGQPLHVVAAAFAAAAAMVFMAA